MAESKNNVVTHGLSGKVGDMLVFSQRHGKTVVSRKPRINENRELSAEQEQHKRKFQQAIIYAKSAVADVSTKAAYDAERKPGMSAFNVAVADLLNAPDIESIDLSAYHGNIGDLIVVQVMDDFKVASVTITISNADGSEVESGNAVQNTDNALNWTYSATQNNPSLTGDKITVVVSDLPGNLTQKQETLG